MEPYSSVAMSFFTRTFLVLFLVMGAAYGAEKPEKRPFSIGALEYLLERKEYDRFDFYIASYLRQHPDTAVLYQVQGSRYFAEARTRQSQIVYTTEDRTGGLPRKYVMGFSGPANSRSLLVKITYNKSLMKKAFAAMRKAQALDPSREDVYDSMCTMAMEADLPESLHIYLDAYFDRFGNNRKMLAKTMAYARQKLTGIDSSAVVALLSSLEKRFPDDQALHDTIATWYYQEELFDSAALYGTHAYRNTIRALECDIRKAVIAGNFNAACSLSFACYTASQQPVFLEQAALFALVFDSLRAVTLRNQRAALPDYSDSLSLTNDLFSPRAGPAAPYTNNTVFSGELFLCNFALAQITYNRNRNKETYFETKASIFFACGLYDSAAYYNLNLLRTIPYDDQRGVNALFNLAAEYYATGKYTLSFYRFLDLYRFHKGWNDAGVRYGLGLNYEHFGDRENALIHYAYAANNADKKYPATCDLRERARKRLRALKKKPPAAFIMVPQEPPPDAR